MQPDMTFSVKGINFTVTTKRAKKLQRILVGVYSSEDRAWAAIEQANSAGVVCHAWDVRPLKARGDMPICFLVYTVYVVKEGQVVFYI